MKALGLPRRGNSLLVAEIHADDGCLTGVRPLGGSVAFGERAADALIREFVEELGVTVSVLGGPRVVENIFTH
ncbi:NUDIX domain-containing protein [Methylobacterium phyllosphaerae]